MPILRKQTHIAFALLMLAGLSISACSNTFDGVGRDVENTGEAIQDASD